MSDPPRWDRPAERASHDDTDPLPVVTPPNGGATEDAAGPGAPGPATADDADPGTDGPGRWWRRAGLAALVVLGVLAAANGWLASTVEGRVAEQVERELGAPVDVELRGFPVGFRSLTGELPAAELHGRDVPLPDSAATLTELRLSLTDVRVDRDRGRIEAASAQVTATLDDAAVEELLGVLGRLPLVDLELQPGALRLNVLGFAVADAAVRADDGDLVFGLAAPLNQLVPGELRLDELPLGLHVDRVRLRTDEMELHGRIEPLVVDDRR